MALLPLLITLLFIVFCASSPFVRAAQLISVLSHGAMPDGKTDSTKAFAAAWSQACASTQPATISVPKGSFSLGQVRFQGPCKNNAILLRIDGTLVAPSDYGVIGSAQNWLIFEHVTGVTISGGTLDGQGSGLWSCKSSGKDCPSGATVYMPITCMKYLTVLMKTTLSIFNFLNFLLTCLWCSHLNSPIQTTLQLTDWHR